MNTERLVTAVWLLLRTGPLPRHRHTEQLGLDLELLRVSCYGPTRELHVGDRPQLHARTKSRMRAQSMNLTQSRRNDKSLMVFKRAVNPERRGAFASRFGHIRQSQTIQQVSSSSYYGLEGPTVPKASVLSVRECSKAQESRKSCLCFDGSGNKSKSCTPRPLLRARPTHSNQDLQVW